MKPEKTVREWQDAILRLKKEKDFCILVHAYQTHDLWEIADFVGDSYGLSEKAATEPASNILMCGVRFMAETAKILSPEKRVFLSHPEAGCPMAECLDPSVVLQWKKEHPQGAVVAYVNTTAELKRVCDVCVTSSSALQIVKAMPEEEIFFIPDCNLGAFVAEQIPEKRFHFVKGGCPVHGRISVEEVLAKKAKYPSAKLLVHPECIPPVTALADYAGSTTGILSYAKSSDAAEFLIGTENSIVEHLQYACPEKRFYPLSGACICSDMRLTTLPDVYRCLADSESREEIYLSEETLREARRCLDAMLRYGG